MNQHINNLLSKIRVKQPLILNVTNQVTMNFVANGLLSLGSSPLMTQALEELEDLVRIADAVVINLGTLNQPFLSLCQAVCHAANKMHKPIVLDPVGVGASAYRTKTCLDLLEQFNFDIIRGNASEISALSGAAQQTKGVDSTIQTQDAVEHAQFIASKHDVLLVVSGKTDAIIDANRVQFYNYGSELMPRVTGSGCLLTAVIAAFRSVHLDAFDAASYAVVFYGLCGALAAEKTQAPGSFAVHFLDALAGVL